MSYRSLICALVVLCAVSLVGCINKPIEQIYFAVGESEFSDGAYRGAVLSFDEAIGINPYYAEAYYWRGKAKAKAGDSDGARVDLKQGLDLAQTQGKFALVADIEKSLQNIEGKRSE